MTGKVLALAALLIASPAFAQQVEHAPTVAQCQADQRLWFSMMETAHGVDKESIETFGAWQDEMIKCDAVDPSNRFLYMNTRAEASSYEATRYIRFLVRHNLYKQALAEDKAGAR